MLWHTPPPVGNHGTLPFTNVYMCVDIYLCMHRLLKRYAGYVSSGEVKEMEPLPMLFSFEELQYLYFRGFITELDNKFIAVVTDMSGEV